MRILTGAAFTQYRLRNRTMAQALWDWWSAPTAEAALFVPSCELQHSAPHQCMSSCCAASNAALCRPAAKTDDFASAHAGMKEILWPRGVIIDGDI